MILILKYAKEILDGEKSSPLDRFQRMSSRVELPSSSTIYGSAWFRDHRKEPNVSRFLPRSLPYTQSASATFKVILTDLPGLQLWIVAEVCARSLST